MSIAALVIAAVALAVALAARATAAGLARRVDDAAADARRRVQNATEELGAALETTRRLMARLAAGEALAPGMILEGRLWREVGPEEGKRMVEAGGAHLIDVRTPQETRSGVIPGARLIPIDELPARLSEVPRDGRPTLVYCAGGSRSAAACELLSREGVEGLHNLEGGFSSWSGSRATPGV